MWRSKSMLVVGAIWAIQWVLWLAYTNNVGYREMIAGAIGAGISTFAVAVYVRQGKVRFRFRGRDVAQLICVPWETLKGTAKILIGLRRQLFTRRGTRSSISAVAYTVGGSDAKSAGRHALTVTYTTITPNSIVLGIVDEQKLLVLHHLAPERVSPMTCRLGAKP